MRTNYILIDHENVQPACLSALAADHFKVIVFVGANQTKLSFDTASAIQRMGSRAQYIKISGNGPNALDFHIAFYIGKLAAQEPDAYFHIISIDKGFDPLIQHLKDNKIFAARSKDLSEVPAIKASNTSSTAERIGLVIANLQQRGASKPRTLKTLTSTIGALFQKQLNDSEVQELLQQLQVDGHMTVADHKVTYTLPTADGG